MRRPACRELGEEERSEGSASSFYKKQKDLDWGEGRIWFAAQTSLRIPDSGLQRKLDCAAD